MPLAISSCLSGCCFCKTKVSEKIKQTAMKCWASTESLKYVYMDPRRTKHYPSIFSQHYCQWSYPGCRLKSPVPLAALTNNRVVRIRFSMKHNNLRIVRDLSLSSDQQRPRLDAVPLKTTAPVVRPVDQSIFRHQLSERYSCSLR